MRKILQKMKNRIEINKIVRLYYIGFAIFAFSRIWQYSYVFNMSNLTKSILRLLSFVFLMPKVLFQDYNKKTIETLILFFGVAIVCIVLGGDKNLLLIPMLLIGIKDIDIRKILNILFATTLFCLLIHCLVFMINYIRSNQDFFSVFHISSKLVKNKIMFYDNNMWAMRFTCCVMQYMYLTNRDINRYIKAFILFLLSVFMMLISQSKASFIICILLILYMLFENSKLLINKTPIIRNISIIFGFMTSILLVIIPIFPNRIFAIITKYLTGRPTIYNNAFNYMGVNLLPKIDKFNNMSKVFGSYTLPDNSYISVFLKWGLLLSLIMFILTFVFINRTKNEPIIDYFIAVIAIWFIVEFISMEFVIYFVPLVIFNKYFNN